MTTNVSPAPITFHKILFSSLQIHLIDFHQWISNVPKSPNKFLTSQFAWFLILLSRKLPTSWKSRKKWKKSWREHNVLWTFSLSSCTLHRSPSTYASTHAISLKLNDSLIRWTILVLRQQNRRCGWRRSQVQLSNSSELVWRRKKPHNMEQTAEERLENVQFQKKSGRGYEENYIKIIACELLNELLVRTEYIKTWNWSSLQSVTTNHTSLFFRHQETWSAVKFATRNNFTHEDHCAERWNANRSHNHHTSASHRRTFWRDEMIDEIKVKKSAAMKSNTRICMHSLLHRVVEPLHISNFDRPTKFRLECKQNTWYKMRLDNFS